MLIATLLACLCFRAVISLSSALFCDIATLLASFRFRASISLFSALLFDMASLIISLCFEQSASACIHSFLLIGHFRVYCFSLFKYIATTASDFVHMNGGITNWTHLHWGPGLVSTSFDSTINKLNINIAHINN